MRLLYFGIAGDDVTNWQKVLINSGYFIDLSGVFDGPTHNATMSWQKERDLVADGVVGDKTRARIGLGPNNVSVADLNIKFKQAKNYTKANRTDIRWIVIHSMEAPEASTTAENVANWFASPAAPKSSAHFCIDSDSIIQCVLETDIAWHAQGGNKYGIGLEHSGYARQTREQWLDSYSQAMLSLSAKLSTMLCDKFDLPKEYVDREGLKAGLKGITTHNEITKAFNIAGGHYDPGPNFPMDYYIDLVNA